MVVQLGQGEHRGVPVRIQAQGPGAALLDVAGVQAVLPVCPVAQGGAGLVRSGVERVGDLGPARTELEGGADVAGALGGEVAADGLGEREDGQGVASVASLSSSRSRSLSVHCSRRSRCTGWRLAP